MKKASLATAITLAYCLVSSTSHAQFAGTATTDANPGDSPFGDPSIFSNALTTFDGIDVKIERLIKDPEGNDVVRLILLVSNATDKQWRLLFIGPITSLVDEFGNVYHASDTINVEHCHNGKQWWPDPGWCAGGYKSATTVLVRGIPVRAYVKFKPAEGFSDELAAMSKTVTLRTTLGYFSNDFKDAKSADIIVNNIPFPR